MLNSSKLSETMAELCRQSAAAAVARAHLNQPALNAALKRRLGAAPGQAESLLQPPILEAAHIWKPAAQSFGDLAGNLLSAELVDALDSAGKECMPRERHPYAHQLAAWQAAQAGKSFLVTSGTGSGKTECFMLPMLDSLLRDPQRGKLRGVRAIIIYPLNALIESQRERLKAWTEKLGGRLSYALYNGLTPEKKSKEKGLRGAAEIGNRVDIRAAPPSILITNVTMLEYMLLRAEDKPILEQSKGLLRWIILDEAHSYVGAQAAEMALLLRRVRAAFGVSSEEVQVAATSATISDGEEQSAEQKAEQFIADLAGGSKDKVAVIHGEEDKPRLPLAAKDKQFDINALFDAEPSEAWRELCVHPRLQKLQKRMFCEGVTLNQAAEILFDNKAESDKAQKILDIAAQAKDPQSGKLLLPWRAHIFHRALGGFWVCVNPACPQRDAELAAADSGWKFGAVWLAQRDKCECGAPCFELEGCPTCGAYYLAAGMVDGIQRQLVPARAVITDEYALDADIPDSEEGGAEEDAEAETEKAAGGKIWLRPAIIGERQTVWLGLKDSKIYNNKPQNMESLSVQIIEEQKKRGCCDSAAWANLKPERFSSSFFIGVSLSDIMEKLTKSANNPALPMGGRRALSFSDSRQGVARLAAKLQKGAERTLTRSFLYHAAQERQGIDAAERQKLEKKLALFSGDPQSFADEIAAIKEKLADKPKSVAWGSLISGLAGQKELKDFAAEVWQERIPRIKDEPALLAEIFLLIELARRPNAQNNAETMGLLQLCFPDMEAYAKRNVPPVLQEAGISGAAYAGLAYAAIDYVFRSHKAISIKAELRPWVYPRHFSPGYILPSKKREEGKENNNYHFWPSAQIWQGKPSRFQKLLYQMIKGSPDRKEDRARADKVLSDLWTLLINKGAAKDAGRGEYQLDYSKAAIIRLDKAWLCPITRMVFGYNTNGISPYDADDARKMRELHFPALPVANAGGLSEEQRQEIRQWCGNNADIARLRAEEIWTRQHDFIAAYPPFFRAQEHSAQIDRTILQGYEDEFKEGEINLLNCSTTMEMGIDISDVALVVNSNVPPSIANYRQRVGRAGRRGEAWAFAFTFCRDLPLEQLVYEQPAKFLKAPVAAPAVRLDSRRILLRHVHAALLGTFVRLQQGIEIQKSIGEFLGAILSDESKNQPPENAADEFMAKLEQAEFISAQAAHLKQLIRGTALEKWSAAQLCAETREAFEELVKTWRREYKSIADSAANAAEADVRKAFEYRAKRMAGEFLLSELARRGFTPSYGFPVDVVRFDFLSGRKRHFDHSERFGEYSGGASRPLDIALREYAPGAEVVIDGLVYESEGVQPAWTVRNDASGIEDLQFMWECADCGDFGLSRIRENIPRLCPQCDGMRIRHWEVLRPAGFVSRAKPHTGYESLLYVPYEMPELSAAAANWQSLPDGRAGRVRASARGKIITYNAGAKRHGYALCLCCGKAEAETNNDCSADKLLRHYPLVPQKNRDRSLKGYCPGGTSQRNLLRRNVRLAHNRETDIFEWQLPQGVQKATALALAAALREALAERLGIEAEEIGVAAGYSQDAAGGSAVSAFLYDKASGGAGLTSQLSEFAIFKLCLAQAAERLNCQCSHGCPACILRADLNFGDILPDRPAAQELAQSMLAYLDLPPDLQIFGDATRFIGSALAEWLERRRLAGNLQEVYVFLRGAPQQWELPEWRFAEILSKLAGDNIAVKLILAKEQWQSGALSLADRLSLYKLSDKAQLMLTETMPQQRGCPIALIAKIGASYIAAAAMDSANIIPNGEWGIAAAKPMVEGEIAEPAGLQPLLPAQLVDFPAANICLIRLDKALNGSAAEFGQKFWREIAAQKTVRPFLEQLRQQKIAKICYQDRYLLTPLHFSLLYAVIAAIPGVGAGAAKNIEIITAQKQPDSAGFDRMGSAVFHAFTDDKKREEVLQKLFPKAEIIIRPKQQMPHSRNLTLFFADGQYLEMTLDQGFGAWRAAGYAPYDFSRGIEAQVKNIKSAAYAVELGEQGAMPMIMELNKAAET